LINRLLVEIFKVLLVLLLRIILLLIIARLKFMLPLMTLTVWIWKHSWLTVDLLVLSGVFSLIVLLMRWQVLCWWVS